MRVDATGSFFSYHDPRVQVIEKPSNLKIAILVAAPIVLVGVWWWLGKDHRSNLQEAVESTKGVIYRVVCADCNNQFEMSAEQYAIQFEEVGVPCPACGGKKAYKVGEAGGDPEQFKEELSKITTVSDVQDALEETEAEYAKIRQQIEEMGDLDADPEKGAKLRRERARLRAKVQALNMRWSEILSS